jgi:ABC-type multidrug transport system ATPase subunit
MTPREMFIFTAKMSRRLTNHDIEDLVDKLILDLGLDDCKDTLIGGAFSKGLSGGEQRRTSIGLQLVKDQKVLFLDEPTTGLDSSIAL